MIYTGAFTLIVLAHEISRQGENGCRVSLRFEKIVILLAAIMSFVAIIDLASFASSILITDEDDLSAWLPGILAYPAGLTLFLFVVFVILPKPIGTKKEAEQEGVTPQSATHSESDFSR